ncbi:histone-like nucleoid-structuring protein, MvaT/MvaU family [Pseudomonas sp. UMAB-40]|uniref:histone-like nucleoid-structuring protein, MvaT/MvaU family n=1 Tax=Pseudomonas sp. UMAB-40 TaxID=1365407 RepID=UPI001C58CF2A|nr:histone-like nucleoid-structuring protein, MvaT/MvaU family [Pseudomonas sp. UMAB-40]
MSLIQEYNELEELVRQSQTRMAEIAEDDQFKGEKEFDTKLRDLLGTYGKSLRDIVAILDPARLAPALKTTSGKKVRKPRLLKVYRNPETGETVETKGGNHAGLKKWKAEYGSDVVEGWLQS